MISTVGKAYEHKGGIVIQTTRPPADNLSDLVTVLWQDARQISPEQRRKAWALIGEIAAWAGYLTAADKDMVNSNMKINFLVQRAQQLTTAAIEQIGASQFSLSDVDMTTARLYITFLIDFCIENGVPSKQPLWELADDIEAYVYHCSVNQVCAVCRRKAGIHHVNAVGMGRNRDAINHLGMLHLPLCWGVGGHHQELHQIGDKAFLDKYHLTPIPIDERIAKIYKLHGGKTNEAERAAE